MLYLVKRENNAKTRLNMNVEGLLLRVEWTVGVQHKNVPIDFK